MRDEHLVLVSGKRRHNRFDEQVVELGAPHEVDHGLVDVGEVRVAELLVVAHA